MKKKLKIYDEAIKPVAEPEVDPTPYTTSQCANQDICALKSHILQTRTFLITRKILIDSTFTRDSKKIRIGPKYSRTRTL